MKFSNEKEATQLVESQESATRTARQMLAQRIVINRCMHDGAQWINAGFEMSGLTAQNGRRPTNWNPDTPRLVATVNRITKLIHECAAATYPDRMDVDITPGDRETGADAGMKAQVFESVVNTLIGSTGYIDAARTANFRRCIDGTYGIMWGLRVRNRVQPLRNGGEMKIPDTELVAGNFESMKLILDPYCQELDLHRHETVIYSDVWTIDQINQNLGLNVDQAGLQTCGELWGMEIPNQSSMIHNRLYATLQMYSQTKGARVYQLHCKDDYGRFGVMLYGIKLPKEKDIQWINWDSPESPFGGCGLPFMLLHGYRRPDSMWSASDAAMLKDDQDRLNLLNTLFMRMLQANAGAQWLVRKDSIVGKSADEARTMFNNRVYGVIEVKESTRERPVDLPQLIKHPDPPAFIQPTILEYQNQMREQVHRPDITAGSYKTHTANATYQTASQAANQVLGNRIREDLTRHEHMLEVGLGTMLKLVKEESPWALGTLDREGFTAEDFAVVAQADPAYPTCNIRIRESSIKFESKEQKEQRLWQAANAQLLDEGTLRRAMAELDLPIDDNDRAFYIEAQKSATAVLYGEEWQPKMLGKYSDMFVNAFQRNIFAKAARNNPETQARLNRAIESQMQFQLAQTQMQAMAENPQPQQPQAAPAEQTAPEEEGPQEADLNSLLSAIEQGSTGGQVVA